MSIFIGPLCILVQKPWISGCSNRSSCLQGWHAVVLIQLM